MSNILTRCGRIGKVELCAKYLIPLCIVSIFVYGYFVRHFIHRDPLEDKFAKCSGCDGWAITHLLFFLLLGFLYPEHLLTIMIIGVIWEFFETFLGSYKIMLFGQRVKLVGDIQNGVVNDNSWWYGRVTDIAFNLIGLIIGVSIARYLSLSKCQ